jgi:large subunit ribosomal protein L10
MRPEKANIVSDLAEKLNRSPFVLVTDYQRMKVDQFGDLRNRLAPAGAEVRVVKNSFLKRAMSDSGLPDVADKLSGQTAIVMGDKDVAPVAKILKVFAAEFKVAALKIGVIDKSVLSAEEIEALADLPSREVLLAQLLGLLLAPATRLVRVLNEPAAAFARLLKAKEASAPTATEKETPAPTAKGKEKQEVPEEEPKGEEPVAEAKKDSPAAEQPATAAETPAAESPSGEIST